MSPPSRTTPKNLRRLAPLDRWGIERSIREAYAKGKSLRALAAQFRINRRSARKIVLAAETELKKHSPLQGLVGVLLARFHRRSMDQVQAELTYQPKTMSAPHLSLAYRRDSFYQQFSKPSDCLPPAAKGPNVEELPSSPKEFLAQRTETKHLERLRRNEPLIRALLTGVLAAPDNFLRNNLPIFETAIVHDLEAKPAQIWGEVLFCFWFMFGREGILWLQTVDRKRFRWHIWKIRRRNKEAGKSCRKATR